MARGSILASGLALSEFLTTRINPEPQVGRACSVGITLGKSYATAWKMLPFFAFALPNSPRFRRPIITRVLFYFNQFYFLLNVGASARIILTPSFAQACAFSFASVCAAIIASFRLA